MQVLEKVSLEGLSADAFKPFVSEQFEVAAEESGAALVSMSLVKISEGRENPPFRRPFALFFEAPDDPVLPQGNYWFRHSDFGSVELFTVPISQREAVRHYQIVFG